MIDDIAVYLVTRDDEVLLIRRAQRGGTTSPWVFPADTPGDTPIDQSIGGMIGVTPSTKTTITEDDSGAVTASYIHVPVETSLTFPTTVEAKKWVSVEALREEVDASINEEVLLYLAKEL